MSVSFKRLIPVALVLPIVAPASLIAWVTFSMARVDDVPLWSIVFAGLPFVAIWMARSSVDAYLASFDPASRPRTPEGLVQFTPGYFDFHAERHGTRPLPYKIAFYLLSSIVILGWLSLWALPLLGV